MLIMMTNTKTVPKFLLWIFGYGQIVVKVNLIIELLIIMKTDTSNLSTLDTFSILKTIFFNFLFFGTFGASKG